ncbi:MAG TPA: hypothetical protein VGT24_06880 [Candidatus Acidoferrales bacterium]|nr:hypothetical protein [Candidatus Acidoferrales bacterium]
MKRLGLSIVPAMALIGALISIFAVNEHVDAVPGKDPHRPVCSSAQCRRIKSFLKSHYCGESPFGNGPDDGCEIKGPTKSRPGVDMLADFHCRYIESKHESQCDQVGQPPPSVREILFGEMHHLGLPANASGQTNFWVWKSTLADWSLAAASYSHSIGDEVELCQVIVIIDINSHVTVLRKLPFQKTDIDLPRVTQWSPIDLADVDAYGYADVILEGDAYEDHWLEVVDLNHGSPQTIFSGLGYYL